MKKWFWNLTENRLRAGWRVLAQIVLILGLIAAIYGAGLFDPGPLRLARIELSLVTIALFVIALAAKFLDKRRFSDFGIHLRQPAWWVDYGIGTLAGLLQAFAFALILLALGWVTVEPVFRSITVGAALVPALVIDIVIFVSVGIMEELIRAYQIRNIAEGLAQIQRNWRLALLVGVVGASLFSVGMHLNQQGETYWIFIFVNSLFYCLCFLLTGRIALAMGMHFAWDFFLSTVISLGGASGMHAAVLFAAPLSLAGRSAQAAIGMSLFAFALDVAALPLIVLIIRRRQGVVRLRRSLAVYDASPDYGAPISVRTIGVVEAGSPK